MKIVTVARKSIQGSATQNVIDHGCGALNVDGCRITGQGFRTGKYGGTIGHGDTTLDGQRWENTEGRWPSNLILQHKPRCQQTGTITAPGYTINRWTDGAKPFGGGAGHEYESEKQPEETVAVWECGDGCAVTDLGCQSGFLKSPKPYVYRGKKSGGFTNNDIGQGIGHDAEFGDGGTAARFFQQVQERNMHELSQELVDYLETMITPPNGEVLVALNLDEVEWSGLADCSIHGLLTSGNPEAHLDEIDRVLKPGAFFLVISDDDDLTGATAACVLEDFGYEIRDAITVLDTPGEFHYVAKAARKERNAGVPTFKQEILHDRCFPAEDVDLDLLWDEINEVVDEQYLENWLEEGIPLDEIPDHLIGDFEERTFVETKEHRNNHPCVKPIKIMEAVMEDLSEGAVIVDPFMGSGATGIAALNTNKDFIGIEQEEVSLKIAHHRIHHADRANASWLSADIESDAEEEAEESKSLSDFFGI
jgi:DNA modification methylase